MTRRILVTGVTSGLGAATAHALARAGAEVLLAGRNPTKLEQTRTDLVRALGPVTDDRTFPLVVVDLADLTSVRRAAAEVARLGPLDVLVNNAGVMALGPERSVDGFDLQMVTNHFAPFALTGLLLPTLIASGDARVVAVSSQIHRLARQAPVHDPRVPRLPHRPWRVYAESKLANLLFTRELERRAREAGLPLRALAAHPGRTSTGLLGGATHAGPRGIGAVLVRAFGTLGQSAEDGAAATVMAATADLPGGSYVGPSGPLEMRGLPHLVQPARAAQDDYAADRLWQVSEAATGVSYP
ncbi:SDR family NAD(P)-dependent oxidoreductase [Nocardioides massiliensis]|uniref:NAD(P)-dependent dehydrogenase (Short-subunit alcohol dehydrogenase family) n=1 Tax=Nocardioides massiliensis TaxID=1325935 RepID=A0ABT9NM15_9ACTN|nr:SDR family NAD(P)-dependent oxidoreductase [Nocardioides massiliensis]MDP9821468.1 NAD(P)-dependent dehydrogenase (short-subunit alcohol dehydrogenase family) [Nocardioides massiliensis]